MNAIRITALLLLALVASAAFAQISIPGTNQADNLDSIGTMAKTLDVVIFTWGAKIGAAVIFLLGGWAVRENRLGVALLCFSAGFIMLFAPKIAQEIQTMAGTTSVFGR